MYVPRCVLVEAFDLPQWFHVFLLLVAVSSTFADFKPSMCNVWYMIRKGNGRQPDNICYLILIILSKNKACDCYCHLILIDLSKKKTVTVTVS